MKHPSARQILFCIVMAVVAFGSTPTLAQLGTKLNAADIRKTMAQNTLIYTTISGGTAKAYLAPGEVLRGNYEGKGFKGSWTIRDDMLCFDFPGRDDDRCWSLFRLSDGQLRLYTRAGNPAGYIGVTKGNPNNF